MSEKPRHGALGAALRAYGSDLSRWPADVAQSARADLLSTPEFRRAWEEERSFDRALADERVAVDATIARSGAFERVRSRTLAHLPVPLARLPWQRIAAAMLVAGMLGGATDLLISSSLSEPSEPALIDPLLGLDIPEAR
jgi:hypothetical protein